MTTIDTMNGTEYRCPEHGWTRAQSRRVDPSDDNARLIWQIFCTNANEAGCAQAIFSWEGMPADLRLCFVQACRVILEDRNRRVLVQLAGVLGLQARVD